MREIKDIKFRAWFDDDKKLYYQIENTASAFNGLERFCQLVGSAKGYTPKVMQYTGLKDKNGVEIYEGDIIRTDHNLGSPFGVTVHEGEIVYQTASYGIKVGITITDLTVLYRAKWSIEVIGNIYEVEKLLNA